jgi:diacylglycerol kinase family enzyme
VLFAAEATPSPSASPARLDDGQLDLMILPELFGDARLDALGKLLRLGSAGIKGISETTRSSWIEYTSDAELDINLDGEPLRDRQFRAECKPSALPLHVAELQPRP